MKPGEIISSLRTKDPKSFEARLLRLYKKKRIPDTNYFRLSESEVDNCRFRDCLHCDEPGCSFDKSWERYPQYRKLLDENIKSRHLYLED